MRLQRSGLYSLRGPERRAFTGMGNQEKPPASHLLSLEMGNVAGQVSAFNINYNILGTQDRKIQYFGLSKINQWKF